jgi:RHS repeat-associated protein
VEYQYDQLGRLLSAATQGAGGWGLAWNHDGFGNLTQQSVTKGSLTGFTHSVNGTTNRISGQYYDANGNWGGSFGQSQSYDIENRIRTAAGPQFSESYLYSARNERMVSQRDQDRHRVHFYGADGLLLGIYTLEITQQNPSYTYPVRIAAQERIYFGGRLMQIGGEWVATDRLGSVVRKGTTNYKYAPYGQEIGGATANDTNKFATYTRDSVSGLDYALNRYYKPEWGRFTSPDPSDLNVRYGVPGSWNMYAYSDGDPINMHDPMGLGFWSAIGKAFKAIGSTVGQGTAALFSTRGQDVSMHDEWGIDADGDWDISGGYHGFSSAATATTTFPPCPYPTPLCGVWNVIRIGSLVIVGTITAYQHYQDRVAEWERKVKEDRAECEKLAPPGDPSQPPGPDWEWRPSGDSRGAWHNPATGESARPGLPDDRHPSRHWDYTGPNGTRWWKWANGDCEKKPRDRMRPPGASVDPSRP